jgi:hypothetical protein
VLNRKRAFRQVAWLIGLAVVSVGCFFLYASSSPWFKHCIYTASAEESKAHGESPKENPSGLSVIRAYRDCIGQFVRKDNGAITAIATVLLTFVTGLLSLLALQQYRTSQAQLRAYLFVNQVQAWRFDDPHRLVVRVEIKNFGQTPAKKVVVNTGKWFADINADNIVKFAAPKETFNRSTGALGPGGTLDPGDKIAISDVQAIMRGESAAFIYGTVIYIDIFGEPHTTTFRYWCMGKRGYAKARFDMCLTGNDAD